MASAPAHGAIAHAQQEYDVGWLVLLRKNVKRSYCAVQEGVARALALPLVGHRCVVLKRHVEAATAKHYDPASRMIC
jgi:hypothetical protein